MKGRKRGKDLSKDQQVSEKINQLSKSRLANQFMQRMIRVKNIAALIFQLLAVIVAPLIQMQINNQRLLPCSTLSLFLLQLKYLSLVYFQRPNGSIETDSSKI
jgi:hypothetical protein